MWECMHLAGAVPAAMDVTECTELLKQLAKEKEGCEGLALPEVVVAVCSNTAIAAAELFCRVGVGPHVFRGNASTLQESF